MAKNVFQNMGLTDLSHLLDEDNLDASEELSKGFSAKPDNTVSIDDLESFKAHPFKVNTESPDFEELVSSIKENGLIYPVLVRPSGSGKYEIISGHRRVAACRAAGLLEIPVIIRSLDDYAATVFMVHSNLYRPEIMISEKARAYRMCFDAEKHQGKHTGIDTAAALGEEASDSRRMVYRYIRLSYLNDDFLQLVDEKKITLVNAVELAYLNEATQKTLHDTMVKYEILPSAEQVKALREAFEAIKGTKEEAKGLSFEKIASLLLGKPKEKAPTSISLKRKELLEYFAPDTEISYMENVIHQLLKKYKEGLLDDYIDKE